MTYHSTSTYHSIAVVDFVAHNTAILEKCVTFPGFLAKLFTPVHLDSPQILESVSGTGY